ncbi:outer membrane beta-barrel protein [Vibrio tapetis]|uniref:Outer membrane protein beta-barrel domain-containing protein n=1 Tax=Vibrio tapetis subsp. tapetis TaxID=1671868 RepID=A0A2N8ZA53_9VIBR|nr:outer membrane beta-barrel protein [Vibrio tapetis]SON48781.1 conserved exported protein of unknown function [Vibrio tapetis subsp. tapetis]
MKKLLLATAVLVSTNASALDFTVLAGVDSNNGPAVAAEIGVGSALIGFQALGNVEQKNVIGADEHNPEGHDLIQSQKDVTFYTGYRFENGIAAKAGFAMSTFEGSISDQRQGPITHAVFRPMLGLGYDFSNTWSVNLHYTTSANVESFQDETLNKYSEYTFEDSVTIMAGFRF